MKFTKKNLTNTSGVSVHNDGKDWSIGIEAFFKGQVEPHTASLTCEIPEGAVPYADYWDVSLAPTVPDGEKTEEEKAWLCVALSRAWLHVEDDPRSGMMILNSIVRARREPVGKVYYLIQPEPMQYKYLTVTIEITGYIQEGARANIEIQAMGSLRALDEMPEAQAMASLLSNLTPAGPTQ